MTRTRSFETAASRRRKDPLVWTIDGVTIELKPSVDLAEMAPLLQPLVENDEKNISIVEAARKRKVLVECVTVFVSEKSRDDFEILVPDIDTGMLGTMLQELIEEFSGVDPTQRGESSDGS